MPNAPEEETENASPGKLDVVFTFTVESDGKMAIDEEQLQVEPGYYAVVPHSQVKGFSVIVPVKRIFHLADLRGLSSLDFRALAEHGYWNSDQVRAAGVENLRWVRGLSKKAVEYLITSFSRLSVEIPSRGGKIPEKPNSAKKTSIWRGYKAHFDVWKVRDLLTKVVDNSAESSFVQHSAGFDIVCGRCGKQFLAITEQGSKDLICDHCGNDIGTDTDTIQEHRPRFIPDKMTKK